MISAILVICGMSAAFGLLLGYAAIRYKVEGNPLAEKVETILPQTQCGQCGFVGCRPYAEAMAAGEADINRCPPGGEAVIKSLAELLGVEAKPLDAENGEHSDVPLLAIIDENTCIGCTLCIQACPVDAIVGAAKHMHTVIASECTGCKLCLPPCPVDCIAMVPLKAEPANWKWPYPVFSLVQQPANDAQAAALKVSP
ncbi:electron transport complex subunit RsxB [Thiothrix sp.]|jgi:electron transport complex protein RnfB|uniref:electron transport complex subunit RsxB n=1 Tax=Thiothrix sp. TaxID=1032 RepID=UPI00257E2C4D|nr:electron transport complex subunit RsxB [Thiothrix sp.]